MRSQKNCLDTHSNHSVSLHIYAMYVFVWGIASLHKLLVNHSPCVKHLCQLLHLSLTFQHLDRWDVSERPRLAELRET